MSSSLRQKENRAGWLFVAPATLHLFLFALLPIGVTLVLSLFRWKLYQPDKTFVGARNYQYLASDSAFLNSIWNSLRYTAVAVPAGIVVALGVAILLNQKMRLSPFFRTLYYLPAISSGVAISMIWIYIYLPEKGLLNVLLGHLGFSSIDFLGKSETALWALAFMSIWTGLGPKMILFLAGLIGVPQTLYEAASLDGAVGWRAFRHITLPMLVPTTLFVTVTSTISAIQIFTPVYMMTKGGPEDSTDMAGYHIYSEAWVSFNTGLASAKSFVLFVIIAVVAAAQFRMTQKQLEGHSTF
ncbi:MAG: sugar ABC transporter permease [Armatimonadetes bacterium]|nr:ABC transporter permease subunit [Armatimonadota bacterium]MBS1703329.1 sugar ABC transporter permease [Armatimonadota bacterium]MBS1729094.1 sugar ABC transporter permease [Armatimonadota bacterium]